MGMNIGIYVSWHGTTQGSGAYSCDMGLSCSRYLYFNSFRQEVSIGICEMLYNSLIHRSNQCNRFTGVIILQVVYSSSQGLTYVCLMKQ